MRVPLQKSVSKIRSWAFGWYRGMVFPAKMSLLLSAVVFAMVASQSEAQQTSPVFDYFSCYQVDPSMYMPNTLENLIGLLYKYENKTSTYVSPENMAEMIISRYRQDGVVFDGISYHHVDPLAREKFKIIDLFLGLNQGLDPGNFDQREKCSLHLMTSHSIDDYPFQGIDDIWNGNIPYVYGDTNSRRRRQANFGASFGNQNQGNSYSGSQSGFSGNQGGFGGNQGGFGGNQGGNGGNQGGIGGNQGNSGGNQGNSGGNQGNSGGNQGRYSGNQGGISGGNSGSSGFGGGSSGSSNTQRRNLGTAYYGGLTRSAHYGYVAATHPIERGVIDTPYGPVAAGTLLTGMILMTSTSTYALSSFLDKQDLNNLPQEMLKAAIDPLYGATLSGDIGEMALGLVAADPTQSYQCEMGPTGRYHNFTTCARRFSLEQSVQMTQLTRAELNAGIDALVIRKAINEAGGSLKLTLSEILRLYYSEKGLPNFPSYKACNRFNVYNSLSSQEINQIYTQAITFMYVHQKNFGYIQEEIKIKSDDFSKITAKFNAAVTAVKNAIETHITGYQYDDEGDAACYVSVNGNSGNNNNNDLTSPLSETVADVIFVYNDGSPFTKSESNRQLIGDTARRLRLDAPMTQVGVLSSPGASWILAPTNVSNIGDWACNFTADYTAIGGGGSGSSSVITNVYGALSSHFANRASRLMYDSTTSSGNSQVVVWQVSGSNQGDEATNNQTIAQFRQQFPDVRVILIGSNVSPYQKVLQYNDDFVSVLDSTHIGAVEHSILNKVHDSPRPFMYPICFWNDTTNVDAYIENSHVYTGSVTPNRTTFIEIPAEYFHLSETVSFSVQDATGGSVSMCSSRTNRYALADFQMPDNDQDLMIKADNDPLQCSTNISYEYPCGRNLSQCNSIYLSIYGNSSTGGCSSGDAGCTMPGQITYTLTHDGLTCAASAALPTLFLVVVAVITRSLS